MAPEHTRLGDPGASSRSPDRSSTWSSRPTRCPRSTTPWRWTSRSTGAADHGDRRGRPADRRGPRALRVHEADRRPRARRRSCARPGAGSPCRSATPSWATSSTCIGQPLDTDDIGPIEDHWEIHRNPPAFDQLEPQGPDVRDRHQGHRPARALRPGRQDRPVRRRRRGQDRPHHGDDPPRGRAAPGRVGLRRRGRAHPRGHRPAARDARVRASSRRPRWSTARWTSRRGCACASAWPR